ncbi:class I adenylate-forming enzyme family protein [Stenotrophobium rhamnosiphilum]|uniref:AMP-dependent synthetase n=1 Tax=Stenotrophobium rhamnosiphilum TaxID=2029166 RepID=A0A2T5MCY0_9GAMM|nr:fatty acid--CoA ligase family protein [Stenotrophobium rhamnosiphilum]PTU30434.1 AMP-dependent synthetase [Stenotrophobium rhamnosiphilum]
MNELSQLTKNALARAPSRPAIEFEGRWFSWGELRHISDRIRALLNDCRIPADTAVTLIPRNRPSAIAALLGLIAQSRNVRMIYAFQSDNAMARDIERLNPAAVIGAAEDFSGPVITLLKARGIVGIVLTEMDATLLHGPARSESHSTPSAHAPAQIEILTSGTTGPPKQFAISYALIAKHYLGTQALTNDDDEKFLAATPTLLFFPLGNISGIYSSLPVLLRGQRAVLLERFSVAGWHDHLLRYRPEISGLPPAGVQMILDADIPPADLACITRMGTGAAPLDPTVHRAFEERYGIPILLSYGATEFGGPVTAMTLDLHRVWGQKKLGSVGRALPGAQLRIVDPDSGTVLPAGQEGLLEVISPRIGPDWIRTSDIALIDEDGFMFHRGRADGAIVRGGFKLLPEAIERALLEHIAVSAAAVIGVVDQRLGQVPAAAIQFKPDVTSPTIAELEAHLRDRVYATHIPVQWRFVKELPRTPTLKVDRRALKNLFD